MCTALRTALLSVFIIGLSGCSHKVGSEAWCQDLKDKPRGDWTLNETADFAKFCLLHLGPSSGQ
jgi:hypothetical protein